MHVEVGGTRELVPRAHADREHDDIRPLVGAVPELESGDLPRAVRIETGRAGAGLDADAATFDQSLEGVSAAEVELGRHEPVRRLHDGGRDIEALQRAGGFEAEQAAADDGSGERPPEFRGAALDEGAQTLDVVERAVDEAPVEAEAVDRQLRGVGARGEHQPVVRDAQPALGGDAPRVAIDARDGVAADEAHPVVGEHGAVEFELVRRSHRRRSR